MEKVILARGAMATRFEFVLAGENGAALRAAGEEAFDEIERIESQLSLYRSGSEIAEVNASAAYRPVRVSPTTFALLEKARFFWESSGGAFDVTVAPLVQCWGFMKGSGSRPTDEQIAQARAVVGMQFVELNATDSAVRFKRAGMMLDLGSIGKGYALDVAAEVLRDAGVQNALLHGGTSTIYGLGEDADGPWKIALDEPQKPGEANRESQPAALRTLAVIELTNQAMSVSAVWGKFFEIDGKMFGHVIDPRTGWPAQDALLGCVVTDSATDSDALSTAVLLGRRGEVERLGGLDRLSYLQARWDGSDIEYSRRGIRFVTERT